MGKNKDFTVDVNGLWINWGYLQYFLENILGMSDHNIGVFDPKPIVMLEGETDYHFFKECLKLQIKCSYKGRNESPEQKEKMDKTLAAFGLAKASNDAKIPSEKNETFKIKNCAAVKQLTYVFSHLEETEKAVETALNEKRSEALESLWENVKGILRHYKGKVTVYGIVDRDETPINCQYDYSISNPLLFVTETRDLETLLIDSSKEDVLEKMCGAKSPEFSQAKEKAVHMAYQLTIAQDACYAATDKSRQEQAGKDILGFSWNKYAGCVTREARREGEYVFQDDRLNIERLIEEQVKAFNDRDRKRYAQNAAKVMAEIEQQKIGNIDFQVCIDAEHLWTAPAPEIRVMIPDCNGHYLLQCLWKKSDGLREKITDLKSFEDIGRLTSLLIDNYDVQDFQGTALYEKLKEHQLLAT